MPGPYLRTTSQASRPTLEMFKGPDATDIRDFLHHRSPSHSSEFTGLDSAVWSCLILGTEYIGWRLCALGPILAWESFENMSLGSEHDRAAGCPEFGSTGRSLAARSRSSMNPRTDGYATVVALWVVLSDAFSSSDGF